MTALGDAINARGAFDPLINSHIRWLQLHRDQKLRDPEWWYHMTTAQMMTQAKYDALFIPAYPRTYDR